MDLLSVILTLRPLSLAEPERDAPFWWGRAAQVFFLSALGSTDPALAARLHAEDGPHPYTVSTLLGRFPRRKIDPGESYTMRLTAFESGLAQRLLDLAQPSGALAPGAEVELDRRAWRIEAATGDAAGHPWAGTADYATLAAALLARPEPPQRRITLQWSSPTTFRSQGRDLPLPLPELVFGSLLERWNAYSPVAFPPETRRYVAECLAVTRYELKTRSVPVKESAQRVGMTGQVSFTTFNYDRYWMSVLHTLAAFSFYSGTGAGTAYGLGQTRALTERA